VERPAVALVGRHSLPRQLFQPSVFIAPRPLLRLVWRVCLPRDESRGVLIGKLTPELTIISLHIKLDSN